MTDSITTDSTLISIWVVEDETLYLEELVDLIEETEGLVCTGTFGDIHELETYVRGVDADHLPHMVLMDIQLPGKSGIEGTRSLRARFPDLIIVMLTLRDDAETIFEALRAGASGYMLKGMPYDQTLAAIREAKRGGMLMPEGVASRVLGHFSSMPQKDDHQLTNREREVLEKMCDGLSQQAIADALFISTNTVNQHIKSIYHKLQVNTRAAAVAKALRTRIVE